MEDSVLWQLWCGPQKIRLSFRFCNLDLRNHPSQGLGLSTSAALIWREYLSVFFSLMFLWKGFKEASSSVSPVCESPLYIRQEFRVHKPDRRQSWLKKFVPIHRLVHQMGLFFCGRGPRTFMCDIHKTKQFPVQKSSHNFFSFYLSSEICEKLYDLSLYCYMLIIDIQLWPN